MEIFIKTQAELDALPIKFDSFTRIILKDTTEKIIVRMARENSSVEAWGNSSVEAWGNSSVVARGNSSVVAWGNSSVMARENSSVEAWGNSSVVAWENSSVEAWENSSVVAWENSSVEAWGNSSVVAWGNVGVHLFSSVSTVTLFMFSVCWKLAKGKINKKSKNCTVIELEEIDWFENNGIEKIKTITLYKKVSKDFKTQEGTKNETVWTVGSTVKHPSWKPTQEECGENKYHACSRSYFCDEFRNKKGDKYIALEIDIKDIYAWPKPTYPHKVAFRKGKVIGEVTKFGKKI